MAEVTYSSGRGGRREDLDGLYVRSIWEANWARYLAWQVKHGLIARWEYEPDTFEFPVKRGSKFYTPDFKVTETDGTVIYHEVKGYMDQASATKLKRMATHYPTIRIRVIDRDVYEIVKRQVGRMIPHWETARGKGKP